MSGRYSKFIALYDSRPMQEKVLVAAAILLCIYGLWYLFLAKRIESYSRTTKARITVATKEVSALQKALLTSTVELEKLTGQYGQELRKQKQAAVQKEQAKVKKTTKTTASFMTADELIAMLRQLLQKNKGLELVSLTKLPATNVFSGKESQQKKQGVKKIASKGVLYEHPITITLRGSFFPTLRYLTSIEKTKLPIFWDMLDYRVIKYPTAEVTLKVHTLSGKKGWVSV